MMNKVIFAGLALAVSMSALAQEVVEDGTMVILPIEAQECAAIFALICKVQGR